MYKPQENMKYKQSCIRIQVVMNTVSWFCCNSSQPTNSCPVSSEKMMLRTAVAGGDEELDAGEMWKADWVKAGQSFSLKNSFKGPIT